MLTRKVCEEFDSLRNLFPDDLIDSNEYDFKSENFSEYCHKHENCDDNIDKIDAGCLWLFNNFYGDSDKFTYSADNNIDIVVCIMMWLGYKLNQKLKTKFPNLKDFYSNHMQSGEEYIKTINNVTEYTSYIDLINKKEELINISNENMSKLYDLFKILCNMINNSGKNDNGETHLKYANEFVNKYNELKNDSSYNEDHSYKQILYILSNDYNYGSQAICHNIRTQLPIIIMEKEVTQAFETNPEETQNVCLNEISESSSEIGASDSDSGLPSSSILNKLISIPFILILTLILLGIAYKYSLLGFRKRSQKQLREKLKN